MLRHDAAQNQFGQRLVGFEQGRRAPQRELNIAEGAGAVFQIRLDGILRQSHVGGARAPLAGFFQDELDRVPGIVNALAHALGQLARTRNMPRFEQRRLALMIQTRDVGKRTIRVADIEFGAVHQHFDNQPKRFFDDRIEASVVLFGGHERDVDVGIRAQFGAPIAADGDENQIVGRSIATVARGAHVFPRGVGDAFQNAVDEARVFVEPRRDIGFADAALP